MLSLNNWLEGSVEGVDRLGGETKTWLSSFAAERYYGGKAGYQEDHGEYARTLVVGLLALP